MKHPKVADRWARAENLQNHGIICSPRLTSNAGLQFRRGRVGRSAVDNPPLRPFHGRIDGRTHGPTEGQSDQLIRLRESTILNEY